MKTLLIAQFLIALAISVASTENGSPSPQPAANHPQYDYGILPLVQDFPDAEAEEPQCQCQCHTRKWLIWVLVGLVFLSGPAGYILRGYFPRRPAAAALGGAKPPFPVPFYVPEALAPVGGAPRFPPFPFSVPAAAASAPSGTAASSSFPFVVLPAPAAPAPGAAALFYPVLATPAPITADVSKEEVN